VWSLAANRTLYEEGPGPAQLNVGSTTEPRYVPRQEALRDYYARWLVKELRADRDGFESSATHVEPNWRRPAVSGIAYGWPATGYVSRAH
jgi:hypothetical protein